MIQSGRKIHPTALVTWRMAKMLHRSFLYYWSGALRQRTVLNSHIVVKGDTVIGEDNQIYQFVGSIGEVNQDLKYSGRSNETIITATHSVEHVPIHRGTIQVAGCNTGW